MRETEVYFYDTLAGLLWEDEDGFHYQYDEVYLNTESASCISQTLPLQREPFRSQHLFPFFDGLIPEGWILEIAISSWKLNPRDRMGLLCSCCSECIGAVRVKSGTQAP